MVHQHQDPEAYEEGQQEDEGDAERGRGIILLWNRSRDEQT